MHNIAMKSCTNLDAGKSCIGICTKLAWSGPRMSFTVRRPASAYGISYERFPQLENGVGLVRQFKLGVQRAKGICRIAFRRLLRYPSRPAF